MREDKVFSAYYVATVIDYTLDLAKAKMALIENHVPHIFRIANDNGFSFQTEVMGMRPNGTVTFTMAIKHPPSNSEITTMLDINTLISIDIQMFTKLSSLISILQPTHRIIHTCCVPPQPKETFV